MDARAADTRPRRPWTSAALTTLRSKAIADLDVDVIERAVASATRSFASLASMRPRIRSSPEKYATNESPSPSSA